MEVAPRSYRDRDIKKLFALSQNQCTMDDCTEEFARPEWTGTRARICHIRAHSVGGPRYVVGYQDVDGYDNLVLLCPNCHDLIDNLEVQTWSIERLEEMKARHEAGTARRPAWADDQRLERLARWAVAEALVREEGRAAARLLVRQRQKEKLFVENRGDLLAQSIVFTVVEPENSGILLADVLPLALEAGGEVEIGHSVRTFGTPGPHEISVQWDDGTGRLRQATFQV